MTRENAILKTKNVLVDLTGQEDQTNDLRYLLSNFCGVVVKSVSEIQGDLTQKRIYVCGDLNRLENIDNQIFVIQELSRNYESRSNVQVVTLGKVPVVVSNAGVYFRQFFDDTDCFHKIKSEHVFQDLTESNKPGVAFRKGIYLANVSKEVTDGNGQKLHYHLLRCSSNFSGPTDNFRETDRKILNDLNDAVKFVFEKEVSLNHVLAQIYENKKKETNHKETKAKIKAHSDKTKDMPQEALIAFCTFYDHANMEQLSPSKSDRYDWVYKDISGLTRLHFKLKDTVTDTTLEKEFSVTLYPNSVFIIPLSTNRLYTHEIRPSMLNIDKIPTRMGYVVRCSNVEAVFMDEQTFIKENGALIKLEEMTAETMAGLKDTYREENLTEKMIKYGEVHFSMNKGDYQKPIY